MKMTGTIEDQAEKLAKIVIRNCHCDADIAVGQLAMQVVTLQRKLEKELDEALDFARTQNEKMAEMERRLKTIDSLLRRAK